MGADSDRCRMQNREQLFGTRPRLFPSFQRHRRPHTRPQGTQRGCWAAHTPDPKGHSAVVGPLMHNRGYKEFGEGYLTEIFTDATIDFLKRHREDPFFVTLSYKTVTHLQRLDKRSTTTARVGGL